jgi:CPA2 family monovalent cation:H+ antiporter-2
MLNALDIKEASAVILAIDNDNKIRLITEAIKAINPTINIIVKVTHQSQINEFKDLNINGFVNENEIVAYELIKKAMQCKLV